MPKQKNKKVHVARRYYDRMKIDLSYFKGRSAAWRETARRLTIDLRVLHRANSDLATESFKFQTENERLKLQVIRLKEKYPKGRKPRAREGAKEVREHRIPGYNEVSDAAEAGILAPGTPHRKRRRG